MKDILARTLYGEAKANNQDDAIAIAQVIINRTKAKLWPSTIDAVCLQPYQFSCWNVSDPNRERIMNAKGKWYDECKKIAVAAEKGAYKDSLKCTHYHTRGVKPKWSKGKTPVKETDGHLFFNDIDTLPPKNAKEALNQKKPLSQSGTIRGAKVATASSIGFGVVLENSDKVAPYLPIVNTLAEYTPHMIAGILGFGLAYVVWRRIDDRLSGKR